VRALREEAHITQETLAWDCGFGKGFLSQVESGTCAPSLAALYVLARRLGVDVVDLLAIDPKNTVHRLLDALRRGDRGAAIKEVEATAPGPAHAKRVTAAPSETGRESRARPRRGSR
jgi:transcriptional regulator with XRE-family HTH domain